MEINIQNVSMTYPNGKQALCWGQTARASPP